MKRLLSATVLAALALGSLAGCGGGEPGGQPSKGASSSVGPSASISPSASSLPSVSRSPTSASSPITSSSPSASSSPAGSPGSNTTDVVIESVDGDWLTTNAENAVALIESDSVTEGFEIVLGGSGTTACAPNIKDATVKGTSLEIILMPLARDLICTADYRPYNFRLLFPEADLIDEVLVSRDPNFGPKETFTRDDFVSLSR